MLYPEDLSTAAVTIEDGGSNPEPRKPIGTLIETMLSRRAALLGITGTAAAAGLVEAMLASAGASAQSGAPGGVAPPAIAHSTGNSPVAGPSSLAFPELRHQLAQGDAVA